MLPSPILSNIQSLFPDIQDITAVSGGDINEARKLILKDRSLFLKYNIGVDAQRMFETEKKGLELLGAGGQIAVPEVIYQQSAEDYAFLILEFVENKRPASDTFWKDFGASLAQLHKENTQENFGLDHSNFIGSLPQSNDFHDNWAGFYRQERIEPQVRMAYNDSLLPKGTLSLFEKLYYKFPDLFPPEPPTLIHGDLWSGNFLCSQNNEPYLIDPSVSYANREMDLGMSKLFGGFTPNFYDSYDEQYPLEKEWEDRMDLYQLYYLLVHVNLFGGSYTASVMSIVKRYV